MRVFRVLRRHAALTAAAGIIAVGLGAFLLIWFQPWKLFTDQTVDEAFPPAQTSASPSAGGSPSELSSGAFRSLEHDTTGRARIIELADGSRALRFEDFRTSNGPDVVVMLSDTPATDDDWHAYDDGRTLYLAKLKGNVGNQNYTIPASADLSEFRSVVVWCRRFTVGFGAAPIVLA